jgi:hypothetical protein
MDPIEFRKRFLYHLTPSPEVINNLQQTWQRSGGGR